MHIDPDVIAAARHAQAKWGVPASVSLAQFGLESGWGAHAPGNNPFGIKALKDLPVQHLATTEVCHGRVVHCEQPFAAFPSITDAFDVHAKLLATAPVYAAAMRALPSVEAFVRAMAAHYATDPQYAAKIMAVIRSGNLTQYDKVTV